MVNTRSPRFTGTIGACWLAHSEPLAHELCDWGVIGPIFGFSFGFIMHGVLTSNRASDAR